MSRPAYIIGGRGHAHVIASFLSGEITFVVPGNPQSGQISRSAFAALALQPGEVDVFLGVGDNAARHEEFSRLTALGLTPRTLIAPSAWVAADAHVGPGAIVCAGAVVGARSRIGAGAIINSLSSVDHDCAVGEFAHVSAGVTLGGGAKIGDRCLIGLKSGIIPRVTLGEDTVVMAGSLVAGDLPARVLAGGNPARILRMIDTAP